MAFAGDHGCTGTVLTQSKKGRREHSPGPSFMQDRSVATVDNAHPCPTPVHLMAAELVKAEGALWGANVGVRGTAD